MEVVIERVLGREAVEAMRAAGGSTPCLLIGGLQLSGKTTVAKRLAELLGGLAGSTGQVVRAQATAREITVEEMSAALEASPEEDVRMDYEGAKLVARGEVVVFECRMAGHLGQLLRGLGRPALFSVFLSCGPRERALRHVARHLGADVRERIEPYLPEVGGPDFQWWLEAVGELVAPAEQAVLVSTIGPAVERDLRERARLQQVYGLDLADTGAYDAVIITDGKTVEEVVEEVLRVARRALAREGLGKPWD
jgi:cytidylate kinase